MALHLRVRLKRIVLQQRSTVVLVVLAKHATQAVLLVAVHLIRAPPVPLASISPTVVVLAKHATQAVLLVAMYLLRAPPAPKAAILTVAAVSPAQHTTKRVYLVTIQDAILVALVTKLTWLLVVP